MAKYSKSAGKKVETVMKEMKKGKLKSGSGQKVTSKKQAIAIGLSEARKKGAKVPVKKGGASSTASKKSAPKKAAPQRSAVKKAAPKKAAAKKASPQRTSSKKAAPKKSSAATKAASKKAAPKKAAPKKAAPKKSAAKKSASKSTAPKKTASAGTTPRKGTMIRRATPTAKPSSKSQTANNRSASTAGDEDMEPEMNETNQGQNNNGDENSSERPENPVEENNNTGANVEEPLPHNAVKTEMKGNPIPEQRTPGDSFHGNTSPSGAKGKIKPSGKKPLYN